MKMEKYFNRNGQINIVMNTDKVLVGVMKINTVFIAGVVIKIFQMNNMIIIDNKQNLNNI